MDEQVIKNFKMYFSGLAKLMTAVRSRGYDEYVVYLNDNTSVIYDDFDHTIRRTPVNSRHMTEEECKREFSNRLRLIMYRKGITQLQLSKMTGIHQTMLSNYMSGKNMPSFYRVDLIAKALDCTMDDLRYI